MQYFEQSKLMPKLMMNKHRLKQRQGQYPWLFLLPQGWIGIDTALLTDPVLIYTLDILLIMNLSTFS